MAQIRELKKRMVAVRNIQRITKTMQMIATTKFTSALRRAHATKPYTETVGRLVAEVAEAAGDIDHPLIRGPENPQKRELVLVISSDRGLCGAYNSNVLRLSIRHLRELKKSQNEFTLESAGKKATGFFKFQGIAISEKHSFGDAPKYDEVARLGQRYIDAFCAGEYSAVRVAYMRFVSNSRQVPEVVQLLPLQPPPASEEPKKDFALYEFSPSSEELLDDLLPRSVKTTLFQAFNDAVVSEQIMRMIAMKAATENAKDLGRTLSRKFNRARQTQITTELMEIIAGAAALE